MIKKTFKEFLAEAPVQDYETFGNFNKGSSFRKEQDRKMITSPKAIKNIHKKWGKIPYDFNLYFLNSAKGNNHTEVGRVSPDWVKQNLDPSVTQKLEQQNSAGKLDDAITIIFTNNKAAERMPMTPWTIAHRFAHAVRRVKGMNDSKGTYVDAEKHLVSQTAELMQYYGKSDFKPERELGFYNSGDRDVTRKDQLAMIYLFQHLATFKSARDKNLRDWFEIMNEIFAQYIISGGTIKFNPAPQCFGGGAFGKKQQYCAKADEMEDLNAHVQMLARDMGYMIDQVLSSAVGNIYVM